jgi:hypothetical protein
VIEFKATISDKTIKRLRASLITANLSGRGLSLPELFIDKLLDLIKEGKTQYTFEIKDTNNG